MRTPSLAALLASFLAAACLTASAEPPPDATTAALASFQKLDAALLPLKAPVYQRLDRQKVPDRLADLKRAVDAIRLTDAERGTPKAAALERLKRAVADADARELAFWTGPTAAAPELPTQTADPLRQDFSAIRSAFTALTPAAAVVSGLAAAPRYARGAPASADRSAVRAGADARRSIADPNAFFDAQTKAGGSVVAAGGPGPGPAPARRDARADARLAAGAAREPVAPVSDLKVAAVPEPEAPPATPSKYKSYYDKAGPVTKGALIAAGATTPIVGPVVLAAAMNRPQEDREVAACREAAGGGLYAKICGANYPFSMLGPAAAGFVDSLFSLGSLRTLAMSLAVGILIPALTGGVGFIFTLLKIGLGLFAVLALKSLYEQLRDIFNDLFKYPSTDPRHWRAARNLGAVAAQLVIAIAATLGGVKLSQSTGAAKGLQAGFERLQSEVLKVGAKVTAPAAILAQMHALFDSEAPAAKPSATPKAPDPVVRPPHPPETEPPTHGTRARITGASDAEHSLDEYLRDRGDIVRKNPDEGRIGAGRQGDRFINEVKTEVKTISGVKDTSSDGLSDAISNRVMNGRGQAPNIIVDARSQPGMTVEIAERGIRRAFGADRAAGKIKSIRIVGNGFDITVPRKAP